jgi:multidrug resistance efflux pump
MENPMLTFKYLILRRRIRRIERALQQVNRQITDRSAVLQSPYRRRAELEARLADSVREFDELQAEQARAGAP